jgi:hypothetical protein
VQNEEDEISDQARTKVLLGFASLSNSAWRVARKRIAKEGTDVLDLFELSFLQLIASRRHPGRAREMTAFRMNGTRQ